MIFGLGRVLELTMEENITTITSTRVRDFFCRPLNMVINSLRLTQIVPIMTYILYTSDMWFRLEAISWILR